MASPDCKRLAYRRIATALLASAISLGASCSSSDDAASQRVEQAPADAGTAAAAPADAGGHKRRVGYVAVIEARGSTDVAAQLSGEIAEVNVRVGDRVKKGDRIAVVDDTNLREELRVADAAVRSAQARIVQARVEVEEAKQQLAIEQRAFAQGTTSKKDVVEAEFRVKKATANRDSLVASLGEQRARSSQLRRRLKDAVVEARFEGTVSDRYLDPGATVQTGTPIVRLITSDELIVRFAVPGNEAALLAVGQDVDVVIKTLGVTITATIQHIRPELDPAAQMIIVEAEPHIPDELKGRVRAGLRARVLRRKVEPGADGGA